MRKRLDRLSTGTLATILGLALTLALLIVLGLLVQALVWAWGPIL